MFSGRIVSSQKFGIAPGFYFTVPFFLNEWCLLRRKCPYSEFFKYLYPRIWTECKNLPGKYPYSVQVMENADH